MSLDHYNVLVRDQRKARVKIVRLAVGLPFVVLGLFLFGQGAGLFSEPYYAVLIEVGAAVVALGIGLVWFALR